MQNTLLKMIIFVLGFLTAVFALAWAISLSIQGQLAENSALLAVTMIVGLILMVVGWKE